MIYKTISSYLIVTLVATLLGYSLNFEKTVKVGNKEVSQTVYVTLLENELTKQKMVSNGDIERLCSSVVQAGGVMGEFAVGAVKDLDLRQIEQEGMGIFRTIMNGLSELL